MRKLNWVLLAAAAAGIASSQTIYSPVRKITDQGITLKGWGSGTIGEEDQVASEGPYSLRVTTRNYFQGGVVNLSKPVNLSAAFDDKNNLLRFSYFAPGSAVMGGGPSAGAGGGAPRLGGSSQGGGAGGAGGDIGGDPTAGGGGRGGAPGAGGAAPQGASFTALPLKNIRMVVTTSDGKKSEAYMPVIAVAGKNWGAASVPLAAIAGFERTNKEVVSVAFSGDATSTFYIGELKIINDATPISGDIISPNGDLNRGLNEEVEFTASGLAGSSALVYEWDFDAADGIQADAEGRIVKRRFRKDGEFTITLTIRDKYGFKKPVIKTLKVKVNP